MPEQPDPNIPPFEQLLETYFANHLPRLLRRTWVTSAIKQIIMINEIRAFVEAIKPLAGFAAVDAIVARTGLSVSYENTQNIPSRGRLLVLANHPVGAADVFLMLQCLHHVRHDVQVVINKLGPLIVPQIASLCLAVDRYATFNQDARCRIRAALDQEQAVILFPAGGISKLTIRGVRDHRWKHGAVHFVRDCQADVLPIYIAGRSSLLFLSLPRKLRHFFVVRELLHPVSQHITVRVGSVIPYRRLATGEVAGIAQQLQKHIYDLATIQS
jgi:putative hemolysin